MSQSYPYTKASVNEDKLTAEIEADGTIEKTLEEINWSAPDGLSITFDLALSGAEETALDTLVTNHDGNPMTEYDRYCICCNRHFIVAGLSAPTTCPYCSSTCIKADECEFPKTAVSGIDADGGYDGGITRIAAGENLAFPNVAYLKSDGKYWLTDNDAEATASGKVVLVLETINADAEGSALEEGYVRDDDWNWGTIGAKLYLAHTHGGLTDVVPSTAGDQIRIVAYVKTADIIHFKPDNTYLEVSA